MLAMVLSCAVVGLDGALVEVAVDLASGLPAFTIVGLPDTAVNEAKERVRAAISCLPYVLALGMSGHALRSPMPLLLQPRH
jgi:hypothetical protein